MLPLALRAWPARLVMNHLSGTGGNYPHASPVRVVATNGGGGVSKQQLLFAKLPRIVRCFSSLGAVYRYWHPRDKLHVRTLRIPGKSMLSSTLCLLPRQQLPRQQLPPRQQLQPGQQPRRAHPCLQAAAECADSQLRMSSPVPWLHKAAFDGCELVALADRIDELQLADMPLVKAFDRYNGADQFARRGAATQWVCEGPGCATLHGHNSTTTISEAVARTRAPLSARVAVAAAPEGTAPWLRDWTDRLDATTGRPFRDADVYVTPGPPHSSASLGWHVDDIDVLLLLLRGRKRFRVAGRTLGSEVAIDHVMCAAAAPPQHLYNLPAAPEPGGHPSAPPAGSQATPSTSPPSPSTRAAAAHSPTAACSSASRCRPSETAPPPPRPQRSIGGRPRGSSSWTARPPSATTGRRRGAHGGGRRCGARAARARLGRWCLLFWSLPQSRECSEV